MNGIILAAALIGPVACNSTEPTSNAQVRVTVERDAALASYPSTGGVTATIPLTIRNSGTTSVWYSTCGNSLERRSDAGWQVVWVSICSLPATQSGGSPGAEIAPGAELTTEVDVAAWLGREWSAPLSGEYRLSAGLFTEHSQVAADSRTTAPFQFTIVTH